MSKESARPICEECDIEMHPYSADEGDYHVSGWGCDGCGWSFDTCKTKLPKARDD